MYHRIRVTNLVLQHNVKRLYDTRRMPPFRGLNLFRNRGRRSPSLRLDLTHRPETTSREGFLELAKTYRQIRDRAK